MSKIKIYTDGSCKPNPGKAGWAAVILNSEEGSVIMGSSKHDTVPRMELTACVAALQVIKEGQKIAIFTDSKYVKNGITQWIKKWKSNGWRTIKGSKVKNSELWLELDKLCQKHDVQWQWVKSHVGNEWNEIADTYANYARRQQVKFTHVPI